MLCGERGHLTAKQNVSTYTKISIVIYDSANSNIVRTHFKIVEWNEVIIIIFSPHYGMLLNRKNKIKNLLNFLNIRNRKIHFCDVQFENDFRMKYVK